MTRANSAIAAAEPATASSVGWKTHRARRTNAATTAAIAAQQLSERAPRARGSRPRLQRFDECTRPGAKLGRDEKRETGERGCSLDRAWLRAPDVLELDEHEPQAAAPTIASLRSA